MQPSVTIQNRPLDLKLLPELESKWARLMQRVASDPVHLDGYAETLKHDFQEFRKHFEFKPDRQSRLDA